MFGCIIYIYVRAYYNITTTLWIMSYYYVQLSVYESLGWACLQQSFVGLLLTSCFLFLSKPVYIYLLANVLAPCSMIQYIWCVSQQHALSP